MTIGKLFAVGDYSQSIYRFRGAEANFSGTACRVPVEGRLGLTRNFRSQPAVLDFVNALVRPEAAAQGQSAGAGLEDYEPLEPHQAQVNPGPCVEFFMESAQSSVLGDPGPNREAE